MAELGIFLRKIYTVYSTDVSHYLPLAGRRRKRDALLINLPPAMVSTQVLIGIYSLRNLHDAP